MKDGRIKKGGGRYPATQLTVYHKGIKMDRISNAENKFIEGYTCSQAILSEYSDLFSLDCKMALKLASGFAGGMRMGKTCGAVTGALMVLGLKFSDHNSEKPEGRKKVYDATYEFLKKFEDINGSTNCRDLLGCDISTANGKQIAKQNNLFKTVCPKFVKSSSELLETMLKE